MRNESNNGNTNNVCEMLDPATTVDFHMAGLKSEFVYIYNSYSNPRSFLLFATFLFTFPHVLIYDFKIFHLLLGKI